MVKRFLRLYAQTEVVPAYERYQDSMKDIESIYKVP